MKAMKNGSLCAIMLLALNACKKEKNGREPVKEKTAVELLTQKKWILIRYGFDDNNNQQVDADENIIHDCQDDNSYEFFRDSSGLVKENEKVCGMGNPVSAFTWHFARENKDLVLSWDTASILALNDTSLVLRYKIPGLQDSARFTTVYKH
jgi:hypothetical protein